MQEGSSLLYQEIWHSVGCVDLGVSQISVWAWPGYLSTTTPGELCGLSLKPQFLCLWNVMWTIAIANPQRVATWTRLCARFFTDISQLRTTLRVDCFYYPRWESWSTAAPCRNVKVHSTVMACKLSHFMMKASTSSPGSSWLTEEKSINCSLDPLTLQGMWVPGDPGSVMQRRGEPMLPSNHTMKYNCIPAPPFNLHLANESDSYSPYLNVFIFILCQPMLLIPICWVHSHHPFSVVHS